MALRFVAISLRDRLAKLSASSCHSSVRLISCSSSIASKSSAAKAPAAKGRAAKGSAGKGPADKAPAAMRFVQFSRRNDPRQRLGLLSEDGTKLKELADGSDDMIDFIRTHTSLQDIQNNLDTLAEENVGDAHLLLPPVINPQKIICIGLNYKCHCEEQKKEAPTEPMFFSKFNTTLIGARSDVIAHAIAKRLDWEVELAVVIGKEAKHVPCEEAMDYIFGYTIAQDITARDWQRRNGGQFLIGKSMDTFLPLGPALVHKSLVKNVNILNTRTLINGVEKQNGNTADMIFKIDDIIHRLTQCITLMPGDVILTGTPKGVGTYRDPPEYLQVGDVIETHIQGLGKMVNKVVAP